MASKLDGGPGTKVFLSYARADNAVARELYLKLKHNGFDVFIDDMELRPQHDLRIELERNLNESHWFLLLWSRNANGEWVLWELKQALSRAISTGLRFVVVALDHSDRPEEIKNHLYIALTPSLRVGVAQLIAHLLDPRLRIIVVSPRDELYRPNVAEVSWYLKTAEQSSTTAPWRLVVSDGGLFNVLAQIYDLPPQVDPRRVFEPLESIRHAYLDDVERLFSIGDFVGTALIKEMGKSQPYSEHIELLPLEACRRYFSWLMAAGFLLASKWLTPSEYDELDGTLKGKLQSLWSLDKELGDCGLARFYHRNDPIDLLFGTEVPLDEENFVLVDLLFKSDRAAEAGITHVVLHLQKSRAPVSRWAERLLSSEWPPEWPLLDQRAWALVFIPQIARALTVDLWKGLSLAKPESLGFAFHQESYDRLGPH